VTALRDFMSFTWNELEREGRRVAPGLIGVTSGVAILLTVIAGTDWLAAVTNRGILEQGGLSRITVTPGPAPAFTNDQVRWMHSIDHVREGYPVVTGDFPAVFGSDGTVFQMANLPSTADRPQLLTGAWPRENQVALPADVMISRKTGATIDAASLVGSPVKLTIPTDQGLGAPKSWTVTVTGVYRWSEAQGIERTVYAPITTLEAILVAQGTWAGTTDPSGSAGFGVYVIDADSGRNVASIASRLEARGFVTQYVEQAVRGLSARIASIQAVAGLLVAVIAAFAALSISNTLIQAVRRRRREIAILLAIGFTPRWIWFSLLTEAAIVGVASTVLGLVVARLVTGLLGASQLGATMSISVGSVLLVGTGALAFCLASAWVPSRRAMQLDPVAVLREE